ncbi:MAG TPA: fibronectin type III domain-containing protein [Myxococcales bacterium]|nr:fibronectin type III domain-containing protein [Myxococcales bacterium]
MSIDLPRCPGAFVAVALLLALPSTGCTEKAGTPFQLLGVLTQAASRPLAAPGSPAAQAISSSEIDVTWVDTNSQEQGYSVERSLSQSSGFAVVASLPRNAQAYADLGLAAGTT